MSTLQAANIQSLSSATLPVIKDSAGTEYGRFCRAFVNFDGTTASPSTIRAQFNVSSITKNGTGNYTVNFTNALSDANYSFAVEGIRTAEPSNLRISSLAYIAAGSFRFETLNEGSSATIDHDVVSVAIFR